MRSYLELVPQYAKVHKKKIELQFYVLLLQYA